MNTLVLDVGGTNVKIWKTEEAEKIKLPSGKDLTPEALIEAVKHIAKEWTIDRISIGYPGDVRSGDLIHGLDDVARDCPDVQVFFAGVKQQGSGLVTSGGRVLTVMATAPSYQIAIARAYEAASKIRFEGMQYRRDIGKKALAVQG